jgi:hypothetical protein
LVKPNFSSFSVSYSLLLKESISELKLAAWFLLLMIVVAAAIKVLLFLVLKAEKMVKQAKRQKMDSGR